MLGPVTTDSAVVWFSVAANRAQLRFVDGTSPALSIWQVGREVYAKGSIHHVRLPSLLSGHFYLYLLFEADSGKVLEQQLQAAALPACGNLNVFLGSCAYLSGWPWKHKLIFESLVRHAQQNQTEELMLWLGDNLFYRPDDLASAADMQARYQKQRAFPGLAALLPSMPNVGGNEGWDSFQRERLAFFSWLMQQNITGIVLVSGDALHTRLTVNRNVAGQPVYELTCSPLSSDVEPYRRQNLMPGQENLLVVNQNNYCQLAFKQGQGGRSSVTVYVWDEHGKKLAEHEMALRQ